MSLPLLLSVPHAGLWVPPEAQPFCVLQEREIAEDGDEGAAQIYSFETEVAAFVTTNVARAIVDVNRAEDDRRADGVVKTHTCWNVPIYRESLPEEVVEQLLDLYYCPYHAQLTQLASEARLGVDCHTMAAKGPPIGPDPGRERPLVCVSNANGTCPEVWIETLARCFEHAFDSNARINDPFKGGYIIQAHANELPWVQLELSRAPFLTNTEKRERALAALQDWCAATL